MHARWKSRSGPCTRQNARPVRSFNQILRLLHVYVPNTSPSILFHLELTGALWKGLKMASAQNSNARLWYRILYRNALRAVQFSAPARYVVRDQLRAAFREKDGELNHQVCQRTNWFLQNAAQDRGLEHKILKNLINVACERYKKKQWKANYQKDKDRKHKPM